MKFEIWNIQLSVFNDIVSHSLSYVSLLRCYIHKSKGRLKKSLNNLIKESKGWVFLKDNYKFKNNEIKETKIVFKLIFNII